MVSIELLLRSRLVNEALSAVLIEAGFFVVRDQDPDNCCTIVIIDFHASTDRQLVQLLQCRSAKIVALTNEADSLAMNTADITPLSGVLTHELSADDVVRSLRRIGAGERLFPDGWVPRQSQSESSPGSPPQAAGVRLSPSECQLLARVVEGHSDKMIAHRLGVTEATAKLQLKSLLGKIRVDNRTQATIWALTNPPELDPNPRGFV
jgi:two-component system, NarL family, nitrate/nitrite response regulator NarL